MAVLDGQLEHVRAVLGRSPVASAVVDVQGYVWFANDAAYRAVNAEREKGPENGAYSLLQDPQYEGSGFREACERMLTEGEPFETDVPFNLSRTGHYQDDTSHQYLLRFVGCALTSESGSIVGGLIQFHDVTREQTAKRALEQSEARLRSYLDHAHRGVWCYEPQHPIDVSRATEQQFRQLLDAELVECNVAYARMRQAKRPEELKGQKLRNLNRAQLGLLENLYAEMIENGGRLDGRELEQRTPDGQRRVVEASVLAVIENGFLERVWGTFDDVTDEKLAEEERNRLRDQLHHAQRLESVGALAGGIAHDFNNALMVILANVGLAREAIEAGSQADALLEDVERAGGQAASMTRALLTFSRQQSASPELVAIRPLLEAGERLLRRLIPETIELEVKASADPLRAFVDPAQFQQVLVNLVVNARDAMNHHGKLTIEASAENIEQQRAELHECKAGKYLLLSVQDTGTGVSPEVRQRMFEPFFTTKQPGKGTGLGLSIVYGIVQQNGGCLMVDSQEGEGTTVSVYLPLAERSAPVHSAPVTSPSVARRETSAESRQQRVLVAEDEKLVRDVAERLLTSSGYEVTPCSDGREACKAFEAAPDAFDVVLLDAVMPGLNGKEVFDRIRALRPDQPIVVCSGYADRVRGGGSSAFAAAPFLNKPYGKGELLEAIDEVSKDSRSTD